MELVYTQGDQTGLEPLSFSLAFAAPITPSSGVLLSVVSHWRMAMYRGIYR
jgi:hypothetical protein